MRLPHDQTSSISFGIDMGHIGLGCRFESCQRFFVPASRSSLDALTASASDRDAHERTAHGYDHQAQRTPESWAFTKGFSRRGRSTL